MPQQMGGQPILVLSEDAVRQTGKDAQKNNISACHTISDAVRTTLGPKGMDKMMVDSIGDVTVTNDGVTILDEMELEHPAAKMMVEVAKTQDEEVGDGTTTAVILSGQLLEKAEDLLDQEIHPTVITKGYRLSKEKAIKELNKMAESVTFEDDDVLKGVAMTAMTGKSAETSKNYLAEIAVDAVKQVAEKQGDSYVVDTDQIKVEKSQGASTDESELVQGVIVDKEKVHPSMPEAVDNAKIALLNTPVEVKETETDAEIQISDPSKLQDFVDQEEETLKEMADQIADSGANVVFCQKGIDDIAQHYLAKRGIFAVRRVKKSDMEKMSRATGGAIVSSLSELEEVDLGQAGSVKENKVSGDNMVFVSECEEAKAVSILVRGGTEHVIDEVERALEDAIGGVVSSIKYGEIVGGGSAPEMELAKRLREYADSVGGREQLAITAFAETLEMVARTLAENAGLDPIDTLVDLRNKHEQGDTWAGIDVFTGKSENLFDRGVIESLQIKTQAVQSASEAAEMVLRIDDMISSTEDMGGGEGGAPAGGAGGAPGGMPGGMGGMGGMM